MSGTFKKALTAWHASPFDIPGGEFAPMRKSSGSGQGHAAYGRGAAYVAESPAISGPGESAYMKEFSEHRAVKKSQQRWHVYMGDEWEWEPLDHSFHDLSSPTAMDTIHRTSSDQEEAGFNWIASRLSKFHHNTHGDALTQIEKDLNELGDKNYAKSMRMDAGMDVDDNEPGYTEDHARMVRSGLELAKKKLRFLGDEPSGGPYSYQVALDLAPHNMLDWDNTLQDHHPKAAEKIKSAFSDAAANGQIVQTNPFDSLAGQSGQEVYSALHRLHALGYSSIPEHDLKFDASESLHKAGIRAIRYLDGESRGRFDTYKKDLELSKPRYVEEIVGVSPREGFEKKITNPKILDEITRTLFLKDDVFGRMPEASVQGIISYITDRLRGYHSDHEQIAQYAKFLNWIAENQNHIEVKKVTKTLPPLKPVPAKLKNLTYNYVVLDPKFIKTIAQYDITGEKLQDYGSGVHLHPVDHDPFKGD